MSFSLMASAFTFPFLLGLWWPRATREGAIAGMLGGAGACVVWYVLGYLEHESLDNWPFGIWPALLGPAVSLVLTVAFSRLTLEPPPETLEIFFEEGA